MQRIDSEDVSATLPAPQPEGSTIGYFKDPDPLLGSLGTKISADWLNGIQEEILSVITEAGLSPNKSSQTQLKDAIVQIVQDNSTDETEVIDLINANAINGTVGTTGNRVPVADGVGGQTLKETDVEILNGDVGNVSSLAIGSDLASKDPSAALEVTSTSGGLLLPRLTTVQRDAISSPSQGLLIENTTLDRAQVRGSSGWQTVPTQETIADNSTLEFASNSLRVKDVGITTAKLAANSVTRQKLAPLGQVVSASCGFFSKDSGTEELVTNLSISFTSTGRPVFLCLVGELDGFNNGGLFRVDTYGAGLYGAGLYLRRNSTKIAHFRQLSGGAISQSGLPSSMVFHIDPVGAGTYTYDITAYIDSSSIKVYLQNSKLLAYEL